MAGSAFHRYSGAEIKAHRKKYRIRQLDFWTLLGVTQSGASRYEAGRRIPTPVQLLLNIALQEPATSTGIVSTLRSWTLPSAAMMKSGGRKIDLADEEAA